MTQLCHQAIHQGFSPRQVSRTEQVEVVQHVVEIVQIALALLRDRHALGL